MCFVYRYFKNVLFSLLNSKLITLHEVIYLTNQSNIKQKEKASQQSNKPTNKTRQKNRKKYRKQENFLTGNYILKGNKFINKNLYYTFARLSFTFMILTRIRYSKNQSDFLGRGVLFNQSKSVKNYTTISCTCNVFIHCGVYHWKYNNVILYEECRD